MSFIKILFGSWVGLISFLIGLTSLITVFMSDSVSVMIALSFFCAFLSILLIYIIYILYNISHLKGGSGKDGYESKANFIKYEQVSDTEINYEFYKTIQVTVPCLLKVDEGFSWSGSELPIISSQLQKVTEVIDTKDPTKYDRAILGFKKAIFYNQSSVLHFHAKCNDIDNTSLPFVASRIMNNTDILTFRVVLKNTGNRRVKNAVVEKVMIDAVNPNQKEKIKDVSFDKATKTFEYSLLSPDVGYIYSITWQK